MNKKVLIGVIGAFVLLSAIFAYSQYLPGDGARAQVSTITGNVISDISGEASAVNRDNSVFEFEGFAPGKSHVGTFDDWQGSLYYENGQIVGADGVIEVSSVNTNIEKLDGHLLSDDFFDVQNFPVIRFTSTNIDRVNNELTGNLEFRGVTNQITVPVTFTDSGLSTEFFLDTTPFNFKYTGINKEVRIKFVFNNQ